MNSYGDELDQELTSAEAYNERGRSKYEQKDYTGAIKDFDKAIELNPNYALAYKNRGDAKYSQEDYEDAIKDYDRAIELDPAYVKAYNNRGNSKRGLKEH